jgi:hypothetical protein
MTVDGECLEREGTDGAKRRQSWLNSSEVVKAKLCPEFTEASRVSR